MAEPDTNPTAAATHYRWRMKNGSKSPWAGMPVGFVRVPDGAEGIEFAAGEPALPPRRQQSQVAS